MSSDPLDGLLRGINHVTLCTSDLTRSLGFYCGLLGCRLRARWGKGAYLEAGSLWLCLELTKTAPIQPRDDDTHLAFSLDEKGFALLTAKLEGHVKLWKANRSEGASLYCLDPDGHKLELHVGSLETRLAHWRVAPPAGLADLEIT